MKNRLFNSYIAGMALAGLILGTSPGFAATATSLNGPLTQGQLQALNGPGATYGTPSNATFPDGPITVNSGTGATLSGGPDASSANSVLLVLSATDASVMTLGGQTIGLTFSGSGLTASVTFGEGDFISQANSGFPSNTQSIANGVVNGVQFSTADHAAADILFSSPLVKGETLGTVSITSPINLRVDVFGDSGTSGTDLIVVGNAANSGAEGVSPIPEPSPMALFGVAAIGLMGVMVVRHRRHHCTWA